MIDDWYNFHLHGGRSGAAMAFRNLCKKGIGCLKSKLCIIFCFFGKQNNVGILGEMFMMIRITPYLMMFLSQGKWKVWLMILGSPIISTFYVHSCIGVKLFFCSTLFTYFLYVLHGLIGMFFACRGLSHQVALVVFEFSCEKLLGFVNV